MDNYAAHKTTDVNAWLEGHPRIRVHFTPTSASWLNLVETWFAIIERQAIHRGTFRSMRELTQAVRAFITGSNPRATSFLSTQDADTIIAQIDRNRTPPIGH
ncbi:transposase [Tomitella cavernea]|uniref:Tc1-like transposase DDE domain-containing protein n=1 Tax=Tomitella cavernea TaxID=1387982 RepID=A0ABP9CSW0_9ACTN